MNHKQIQQFLTIVKYMNLSTAAKELYISQPALSLSLGRMESTLNVRLFFRDGNRLILSPAGERLLDLFRKLNADYKQLYEEARLLNALDEQYITIGFSSSAMLYATLYLTDFLSTFHDKTIKKIHTDNSQILSLLKSKQIDFAITSPPLEDEAVSSINIITEPIMLVVSSAHPLAKESKISLHDLEGVELVGLNRQHKFRSQCDQICDKNNFTPNYVIECDYPEQRLIINESAGSKRYASFVAQDSFAKEYGEGYVMIPIDSDNMSRTTALAWLTDLKLQYEYKELVDYILTNFHSLYEEHLHVIAAYQVMH